MRINSPTIIVDAETAHYLESVLEAGLRQYRRNGANVPGAVATFARDVTTIAGHFRMTVQTSSAVSGVSGVGQNSASVPSRTMDSEEVAVLAGITPSGVGKPTDVVGSPATRSAGS